MLSAMQEGVQHILEWVRLFNSGRQFEGGKVEVYTMVKNVHYPRDTETHGNTAAIHPQLQICNHYSRHPSSTPEGRSSLPGKTERCGTIPSGWREKENRERGKSSAEEMEEEEEMEDEGYQKLMEYGEESY
ncbi:unnamed protein product [Coregonus sp. 'balchen']|nr:unnamed protein product [Coregonus sp. 'balchen']